MHRWLKEKNVNTMHKWLTEKKMSTLYTSG